MFGGEEGTSVGLQLRDKGDVIARGAKAGDWIDFSIWRAPVFEWLQQ